MIVDGGELAPDQVVPCDVCIVGGGPAGITMALELGAKGLDVLLLESGGRTFDRDAHDLDKGTVDDPAQHGALETYRRRRLGGATTGWGGRCVPFDPIDFEARAWVPHSGWPLTRGELDPFYQRAHAWCDLGAFAYGAAEALAAPASTTPFVPGLAARAVTTEHVYRFSPPTNFGKKYERDLARSAAVRVILRATVTELVASTDRRRVERVRARTANGGRLEVNAKRVVLASGGLEVTRLLLLSGLGNDHDLVGRFYQCHVTHAVRVALGPRGLVWDYEKTRDGKWAQRTIAATEDAQREHRLLNHRARVEHPEISDPSHESGVLSAVYLAKAVLMSQKDNPLFSDKVNVLSKGVVSASPSGIDARAHLWNVARDMGGVLGMSRRWLRDRVLSDHKLPSVVLPSKNHTYVLRVDAEQAPNPESRVLLGTERDATGLPRIHASWRQTSLDVESLERTSRLFDEALRASGVGRARWSVPEKLFATGGHFVGTARMASDPTKGVVDPHCRVHGVDNLFVASSATFPTSSYANPTLTILAMALRLADRLASGGPS